MSNRPAPVEPYELAIVGAGIVGLAAAHALVPRVRGNVLLLEAEPSLGAHQSGHNSGVIHSGLYYAPGSSKAQNCVRGRELLYRFCEEQGIAHDRCGKLVVATHPRQLPALERLEQRGRANGLTSLRRLGADELAEHEPHAAGIAGLWVGETGIVDYRAVMDRLRSLAEQRGARVELRTRLRALRRTAGNFELITTRGSFTARHLVACAGLQADRVARLCGLSPQVAILPFRGEYYELAEASRRLVRNLIYPVPDPRFPFLGVHFTRRVDGSVEAGPNAVLALARHGYRWRQISARDLWEMARYRGSWAMAARYWRTGLAEVARSLRKSEFVAALQELIPSLRESDVRRGGAGVRAMAVEPDGSLVDDFRIVQGERMIHVLNAPSPAATASISIGETIADMAVRDFGLVERTG